jgi:hypothetical protein
MFLRVLYLSALVSRKLVSLITYITILFFAFCKSSPCPTPITMVSEVRRELAPLVVILSGEEPTAVQVTQHVPNTTSNVGYDEPSSQVAVSCVHLSALILSSLITASFKSFGEQPPYAYRGNQSDAHHSAGAAQNIYDPSIAPGVLWPEYHVPPDYVRARSLFNHSPSDWVLSHREYQTMSLSAVHLNCLAYGPLSRTSCPSASWNVR